MDESALELVRDWLARAGRDLRSARLLAAADDPPLDIAIYHCQQAAEKSIKAWLQGQDVPFPKTHDLLALVKARVGIPSRFYATRPCGCDAHALRDRLSLSWRFLRANAHS